MGMVERVAAAIADERELWSQRVSPPNPTTVCRDRGDGTSEVIASIALDEDFDPKKDFNHLTDLGCARAAIEAMREPSDKMVDASQGCDGAGEIWREMIAAALQED